MLASLGNGYILDGEQASLQDTNDHFLANLQRDGTYSVVPRVPGGEITPEQLIAIGEVARDFGLYTKITGGQRIDLFGARVEQLPAIWGRLVDAGMESGHAYGKALRTVKSCVGETWCRYGVQDSTSMAIRLELRYRGLRAPHKLKLAVSGCARECAEAQSKDFGVIATERGWNLYVGGNGGMRPRHADAARRGPRRRDARRATSTASSCSTSAPPTASSAPRRGSTARGRHRPPPRVVDRRRARHRRRARGGDGAATSPPTSASGRRRSTDPSASPGSCTFVNAPDEPDPTVVFVRERGQIRPPGPTNGPPQRRPTRSTCARAVGERPVAAGASAGARS